MIRAVIFDMNGVIIDDEEYHQIAWRELCTTYGWTLTENDFQKEVFGRPEKDTISFLLRHEATEEEVERYSSERVKIAMELFKPQIKLTTGLFNFLEELKTHNIPMGIGTSSRRVYMNFIMDTLQIRSYFKIILTAQDIIHGKPDPEMYLKVAHGLDVLPNQCIVFEDSVTGIEAAKSAGMKAVALTTTNSAERLVAADKIIHSFNEITLRELDEF